MTVTSALAKRRVPAGTKDVAVAHGALTAFEWACAEGTRDGRTISERFNWLTAPRSTMVQSSPVHGGVTADPSGTGPALPRPGGRLIQRAYRGAALNPASGHVVVWSDGHFGHLRLPHRWRPHRGSYRRRNRIRSAKVIAGKKGGPAIARRVGRIDRVVAALATFGSALALLAFFNVAYFTSANRVIGSPTRAQVTGTWMGD